MGKTRPAGPIVGVRAYGRIQKGFGPAALLVMTGNDASFDACKRIIDPSRWLFSMDR